MISEDQLLEDRLRWLLREARYDGWTIERAQELIEKAPALLALLEKHRADNACLVAALTSANELVKQADADNARLNAELVGALDHVRVMSAGKDVYIGVIALDGCASAKVDPEDHKMFLAWKECRDAALRSATETKGEPR